MTLGHVALGTRYSERGDAAAMFAAYRQALTVDPGHAGAHFNLAVELLRHGHLDEGWREVALGEAVDRVREKYGFKALKLAGGAAAERHLERPSPGLAFMPSAEGRPAASRGA